MSRHDKVVIVAAALAGLLVLVVIIIGGVLGATAFEGSSGHVVVTATPTSEAPEINPTIEPETAFDLPADASRDVPGSPAITPQSNVPAGEPAFTKDDVLDFLKTYRHPYAVESAPRPVVKSIQFLQTRDAAIAIQGLVYRPDDALLCVVLLQGEFGVAGPPIPEGGNYVYPGYYSQLVFDARTGNLLTVTVGGEDTTPPEGLD